MPKYPYRVLGSLLDRIFRNNINDNFKDIQTDFEEQKTRVDNLIISNPQPSEVQDARGGFPVLRDRLNKVDTDLAEMAKVTGIGVYKYANGDGTDETIKIQNALNDGAGKMIVFPYGFSFKVTSLTIPDNTIIWGYGAKIYNTTAVQKILSVGNNVKIFGLEIQGLGNSVLDYNSMALAVEGSYNSTLQTITNKQNVLIQDCYIHDFRGYGIFLEYAGYIKIKNTRIENIGYAGVQGMSVFNVTVSDDSKIKGISPGSDTGLAYNVTYNRRATERWGSSKAYTVGKLIKNSSNVVYQCTVAGTTGASEPTHNTGTATDGTVTWAFYATSDLVTNPRSKNCTVRDSVLEDNTIWEALDTHAGDNILFKDNKITNCKFGVAIVPSQFNGVEDYAPIYCKGINNQIEGTESGYGLVCTGAAATLDLAIGCELLDNTLRKSGKIDTSIGGSVYLHTTRGAVVRGNTIIEPRVFGINLFSNNKGFLVDGNTVIDPHDGTYTAVAGIVVRDKYNEGVISHNILLKINSTLNTNVAKRGVYLPNAVDNTISIRSTSQNNYESTLWGMTGVNIDYGVITGNGAKIYCGSGSPEGIITAVIGSEYFNVSGGANTTRYLKETGSGNTGWVAK